jgi:carbonic anhydrase
MATHTCKAMVVHCMDFRLQKSINDWLQRNYGLGDYDRLSLAGGVFDLEYVMKQVETSRRLHEIKKVVLPNHEDCGAYGAQGNPQRHTDDLHKAEQSIKDNFPELQVELYYMHLSGIIDKVPSSYL